MTVGFGNSRYGRVEWIKDPLEKVGERIESEDVIANAGSLFQ